MSRKKTMFFGKDHFSHQISGFLAKEESLEKFKMMKLPTKLPTNYYTTLQIWYQEEQCIMTIPWHSTYINLRNTTKYNLKYKVMNMKKNCIFKTKTILLIIT